MSAIDVLARAFCEATLPSADWDSFSPGMQESFRLHAEVVAARMMEADTDSPVPYVLADNQPAATTLEQAVEAFAAAGELLNTTGHPKDLPAADAVRFLDRIRHGIDQARYLDSNLVTHVYLRHEHGKTVYDGIGQINVYRTKERKAWDVRGVCQAVIDKHMEATGGELPNDPWTIVEWVLEVLPGGDPRLTPLRSMGLDPENYHTVTPGNPTVSFPPRT